MAIISSLAIGKARNSAGNLTFSTIKGRTIAREKPTYVRNPQTPKQMKQRNKMSALVALWRQHLNVCKPYYTVIKGYGSSYNEAIRLNMPIAEDLNYNRENNTVDLAEGIVVSNGKFGANSLGVDIGQEGAYTINILDNQLKETVQIGDQFVLISANAVNGEIKSRITEVTEDNIQDIVDNDFQPDVGLPITGGLYALLYYSSSRNISSSAVLTEVQ